MVIFNSEINESDEARYDSLGSASFVAYLMLIGEPLVAALGMVLMRSLRKLSNMTVSCYANLSTIFVQFIWVLSIGDDLYAYKAFDVYDWLAISACSVCLVFVQVLQMVAMQNLPVPVTQPLQFL